MGGYCVCQPSAVSVVHIRLVIIEDCSAHQFLPSLVQDTLIFLDSQNPLPSLDIGRVLPQWVNTLLQVHGNKVCAFSYINVFIKFFHAKIPNQTSTTYTTGSLSHTITNWGPTTV